MKNNIQTALETVNKELQALMSLYVETEAFQGDFQDSDAWEYALCELNRIRGIIRQNFCDPTDDMPLWQVLLCASNAYRILDETEFFIRQCEVPGVATRWKKINPRLIYFDCAFELMEKCPDIYRDMRHGLTGIRLSCYPDQELVRERNAYFAAAKEEFAGSGRDFSEAQLFQDELLRTLPMLFEEAAQLPGR
ncbi:MAG: hypothetical protein HFI35_01975 [Roseburia sp.]|jgi:hypothetical protein|nr:hypothetical protein [Roseburia sp.]